MDIIPPVIVIATVRDTHSDYDVYEQSMVINSIPVYRPAGFRSNTLMEALAAAEKYQPPLKLHDTNEVV